MGFSKQEYRSGLPFLPPGDLPDFHISCISCIARQFFFLPLALPGKPNNYVNHCYYSFSAKHGRTWKITKSFKGVSTRRERRLKYSSRILALLWQIDEWLEQFLVSIIQKQSKCEWSRVRTGEWELSHIWIANSSLSVANKLFSLFQSVFFLLVFMLLKHLRAVFSSLCLSWQYSSKDHIVFFH